MNTKLPNLYLIILLAAFALFFLASCTTNINAVIYRGGNAELSMESALLPRTIGLIDSLRSFSGEDLDSPILDAPSIALSLSLSSGVSSVSFQNISNSSLEGRISISDIGNFLSGDGADQRLIIYTEGNNDSSIKVNLSIANAPYIISMLSSDVEEYLLALMAPCATGEIYTREEYIGLLSMVYGNALAAEIANAIIGIRLVLPGAIRSAIGGSYMGNEIVFNIPLVDIMVLEESLYYEIYW